MNYDLYLLYMYDRLEFPSSCKVSNYNSGRKLYPLERKVGSYKYGKSVLKYMYSLVFEADASPCSVIEESFKTKHNLYSNKNVWYLSSHVRDSRNSISVKLQTTLHIGGVTINPFSINIPIMDKPGRWFLLVKCLKNTCGRVIF